MRFTWHGYYAWHRFNMLQLAWQYGAIAAGWEEGRSVSANLLIRCNVLCGILLGSFRATPRPTIGPLSRTENGR